MCLVEKQRDRVKKKKKDTLLFIIFINGSGTESPLFLDVAETQRGRMCRRKNSRSCWLAGWATRSTCCHSCARKRVLPRTAMASKSGKDRPTNLQSKSSGSPGKHAVQLRVIIFFWKLTSLLEQWTPFAFLKHSSSCVALLLWTGSSPSLLVRLRAG